MTQPAESPSVSAAPVVTPAPPAEPAGAAKTEAPQPVQSRPVARRIDGVQKKSYGVKPSQRSVVAPAPTPPTMQAAEQAQAAKTEAAKPAADVPQNTVPPAVPEASAVDSAAKSEEKPPTLTAAEEAKRLARINRESARVAQEKQALAQERQAHAQSLQQIQLVQQAAAQAKGDPLAFMAKAFGISEQQILDHIIQRGAVPKEQRQANEAQQAQAARDARIAELEKAIQQSAQQAQQAQFQREVESYKQSSIAPVLADATKYELTTRALGSKAADEVFSLIQQRFNYTQKQTGTGEVLTPAQAADMIEAHYRSQRDLLTGTSAKPSTTPATKSTETATAKPSVSQAQKPTTAGAYAAPKSNVRVTQKRW